MVDTIKFGEYLRNKNFDFFTGVPCSYQTNLINYAINNCDYLMSPNEGDALATCAGAYISGKNPVVLMQNSGLGNAISPLTSLNSTFNIPILGFVSHRGKPGTNDEPQHELMGEITTKLIDLIGIEWAYLPNSTNDAIKILDKAIQSIMKGKSFFLIINKDTFSNVELLNNEVRRNYKHSRLEVLSCLLKFKSNETAFIATTGKSGRELYELQDIENNFYMVGSMGCISSLCMGISKFTNKKLFIIDGDGSILMRMGNLTTLGHYKPPNIFHIVLDNNSHDSTGGQKTISDSIKLDQIAKNSGYEHSRSISSILELENEIKKWISSPKLTLIVFKINQGSKKNLGRPKTKPVDVIKRFKDFINE